jgi:hypothetical protein
MNWSLRNRTRGEAAGWKPLALFALFAALFVVACLPLLTHRLPPLSDYVNHLARIHVINAIDRDPFLARFYLIDWQVIPNLMIDLLVPMLDRLMGIYDAGRAFTIFAFFLIASGTLVLNRALFGRWSALPLVALLFLYNGVFQVGVLNYVFGIGLALWALAGWVYLRERNAVLRLSASAAFVAALFFCHLFAVGLYGFGLLAIELHRLWQRRNDKRLPVLIDFVVTGAPFLIVLPLMLVGPTISAAGSAAFWEWGGKIEGIKIAINVYYLWVGLAICAVLAFAAIFAARQGVLRFHPLGWFFLIAGALLYLAMPRSLFAAHMADQRLPIAILFMLIACFSIELQSRAWRAAAAAGLLLLVSARTAEVEHVWNDLSLRTSDFLESVNMIERGARVLVVHGSGGENEEITNSDLVHAASLATIERSALVTTAFTVRGKHILQVRDPYKKLVDTEDRWPPSLPFVLAAAERDDPKNQYFWELWPRHYDYVYILFTKRGWRCSDRKHLQLVHEGPEFQLYRVIRTDQAQSAGAGPG